MSLANTKVLDWSGCPIITREPGKMGGVPIIRRMRITPEAILMHWEDGMELHEIQRLFPSVSIEDMKIVIEYAESRGISTVA